MISIFDDSSRESCTNSPDNEQFRARREFLKSGLPESLRKQIAKTTATKEAYSLSCSSFQLVTHTKQTLKGRPLLPQKYMLILFVSLFFTNLNIIKPKMDERSYNI